MKSPENFSRKTATITEIVIILVLLVGVLLFYSFYTKKSSFENGKAVVILDGEVYSEFSLQENKDFFLEELGLNLTVLDQKVAITENDCENQNCVKTGFIGSENEVIVCLPKKIVVKIFNEENVDYDVILQ